MNLYERIGAAGFELPNLTVGAAPFKPFKVHGNTLIVSGQLPVKAGAPVWVGKVPSDVSVDDARHAARLCVMNILGWAHVATGGRLERIESVLRVGGFVATSEGFADAPSIVNAASELLTQIFGEAGEHARIAIGVASLPFNAPVEVEATFALAS
ncbi:RidA family protein [Pandoraea fibrosis]|uniref:RidA family protein n=1 Tax=Pandoraea fibrosis TaxID=1891094 RepID=A0ABX6HQS6_9BURK|nr:RidA family protein [Pandoraea fibrosis]QHE93188.1 RidA family protein [Pandoraea fibrosis]QHF13253.1 RidA family protein [Pandoraea fibrosis]